MRDVHLLKLRAILAYPLFQQVGQAIPSSLFAVSTWSEAVDAFDGTKWKNCRIIARNRIQELVEQTSISKRDRWDRFIDDVKPQILSFATSTVEQVVPQRFRATVTEAVVWDLMFICIEVGFQDVISPPFFLPVLDPWYAKGHFPCGWNGPQFPVRWDGELSGGKLVVY